MAPGATLGATPRWSSTEEHCAHRFRSRPLVAFDQVAVHVFGDRDTGVTEDLGDNMQRGALGKHQRRARVPQFMRMPVTQACRLA
jgi:hypothetical protein